MSVQKYRTHLLLVLVVLIGWFAQDSLLTDTTVAIPDTISTVTGSDIPADMATSEEAAVEQEESKPDWTSILPPILAIAIALILKQVLISLFLGVWLGAWLITGGSLGGIFTGFFDTISVYIVPGIADPDRVSIIVFTLLIGGMVGIITANGGIRGIINVLMKFVKTRIQGQIVTSLLGFLVFFDDYANTMIVGNTMRPLTDRLTITRAKLAYLVDSTAAPVATIALVSTWIGAMVAYIAAAEANMPDYTEAAYLVFVNSLPYNFYAFFAIAFVLMIAGSGRDFGPMLTSRMNLLRAKNDPEYDTYKIYHKDETEQVEKVEVESSWLNAAIPIAVLIISTIAGLIITGSGSTIQDIIGSADSYKSLVWGGLLAMATAGVLTIVQGLLSHEEMLKGMLKGMHVMFDGLMILVMAWALSDVTVALGTADYLVSVFDGVLNPYWVPVIIFVISAGTSFATGSSWGTMGILMPISVPLVWNLGITAGLPPEVANELIYASVSAVLAGSVWGDHCSPISDTTILSSIASQCDHIEHVRTQLPYAFVVGVVSILAIISATVLDISPWIIYPVGIAILVGVLFKFGRFASLEDNKDPKKDMAG
jgi:Na+/H+ antiporter NhaC